MKYFFIFVTESESDIIWIQDIQLEKHDECKSYLILEIYFT